MIGFTTLYEELAARYGPQHWWPAKDPFEIMLGAILVQRTAWRNAALALAELREHALLDPEALAATNPDVVAELVRSAGFFRSKAARVCGLAAFVRDSGGIPVLREWPTARLRETLLDLNGVGPETADAILLYAFERPVVVIDEYLRRLVRRLRSPATNMADDDLRESIFAEIDDASRLNEFHALIVEHGKRHCASRPRCEGCLLRQQCGVGASSSSSIVDTGPEPGRLRPALRDASP